MDEVIDLVGLAEKRDTRVNKLSGGQQRRLDVAVALAGDPELLFLDEPTTGFDPNARRNAWEIVKNLTAIGKTIFLTTHFMDEAQYLANRVAVIAAGPDRGRGHPGHAGGARSDAGAGAVPRPGGPAGTAGASDATVLADGSIEMRTDEPDEGRPRADGMGARARLRLRPAGSHPAEPRRRVPRPHRREEPRKGTAR